MISPHNEMKSLTGDVKMKRVFKTGSVKQIVKQVLIKQRIFSMRDFRQKKEVASKQTEP